VKSAPHSSPSQKDRDASITSAVWTKATLQSYITEGREENLTLEYKRAAALAKADHERHEITKDVSAMANSAGGTIIYGIAEGTGARQHLPEALDPIDRQQFSREWLEHVIGTIEPRIEGLLIHPVQLDSPAQVAYVVEIPQSTTAHQARDLRYYQRYNFESVAMHDYQIRDVMNRSKLPDMRVAFGFRTLNSESQLHTYQLTIVVSNNGPVAANHWKLEFTFPRLPVPAQLGPTNPQVNKYFHYVNWTAGTCEVSYYSDHLLFPGDAQDLTRGIDLRYSVYDEIWHRRQEWTVPWTVYADNMPKKTGQIPFADLQCF
jgi:hypothetical protein